MIDVSIHNIATAEVTEFISGGRDMTSVRLLDADGFRMGTMYFEGNAGHAVADAINSAVAKPAEQVAS